MDAEADRHFLWRAGDISYLHHQDAAAFWSLVRRGPPGEVFSLRCPRRYGKSYGACVDAVEYGLTEGSPVLPIRYAAPTKVDAWEIVAPHIDAIIAECPAPIRPVWRDLRLHFASGCVLTLAGCDDRRKANRLRGRGMGRGYVDEAGSIPEFRYVLEDVLEPQLLTTRGKIVVISSPSETPAHESSQLFRDRELRGHGWHRTIYDAPHISPATIAQWLRKRAPHLTDEEVAAHVAARTGPDDPTWQREYMAEMVTDARRAVVPEFRAAQHVMETVRPELCDTYVALDIGYHDLSFAVFAHYDFERGRLVIEDEVVMQRKTSNVLDTEIEARERALWGDREVPRGHPYLRRPDRWGRWEPYARIADAPDLVIAEMRREGRRPWRKPDKDDADAALNQMRKRIGAGQVIVHPRCARLIDHLEHAIWNGSRTDYMRPEDAERYGHFDGVDAVKYLVRHVEWTRNPFFSAADSAIREREAVRGEGRGSRPRGLAALAGGGRLGHGR